MTYVGSRTPEINALVEKCMVMERLIDRLLADRVVGPLLRKAAA